MMKSVRQQKPTAKDKHAADDKGVPSRISLLTPDVSLVLGRSNPENSSSLEFEHTFSLSSNFSLLSDDLGDVSRDSDSPLLLQPLTQNRRKAKIFELDESIAPSLEEEENTASLEHCIDIGKYLGFTTAREPRHAAAGVQFPGANEEATTAALFDQTMNSPSAPTNSSLVCIFIAPWMALLSFLKDFRLSDASLSFTLLLCSLLFSLFSLEPTVPRLYG